VRFDRLRLEHFKCYEAVDVRLDPGVTVIHGLNGSGKSSLLEAAFFALYGSKALGPDRTLDDIVTIGAEETVVELWFTHAGRSYHLKRRLRVRESGTQTVECVLEGDGGTGDEAGHGPGDEDGEEHGDEDGAVGTYEGATDVRRRVAELLRMDRAAFVNCAFVRQGEVNKLIEAAPGERQTMIDDLLQLGKLEDYRERADRARVGVGRVRDDTQGALAQLDDQIAAKEEKDLHDRLNETESELASVQDDIEHYEEQRAAAVETKSAAENLLETYEEMREELDTVEADVERLREAIAETAGERDELAEEIQAARETEVELVEERDDVLAATKLAADTADGTDRDAIEAHLESLEEDIEDLRERNLELIEEKNEYESDAERARDAADDLAERAETRRAEAAETEAEIDAARETLADRRETLDEQAERIAELEGEFEDAPVDEGEAADWHDDVAEELSELREDIATREATLESERDALAEATELLEAGKCPTCGQDVAGAPHVDTIDEDEARIEELESELAALDDERDELVDRRDRATELRETERELASLRDERSNLADLLDQKETTIAEKAERIETLREEADDLEERAEAQRETAADAEAEAEAVREAIGEANTEQSALRERIERIEELLETWDDLAACREGIERREERRQQLEATNDERRERLAEKRERKRELSTEIEDASVEEAREERREAEAYVDRVDEELASLRDRRDELQEARGAIRNEIEELEALGERREDLAETLEHLESLYSEAADLEEMYGSLRAELRQRNVESLERMLNESFDLVYENDSYSHIELDGEYRLTVYQKDGEPLAPDQLSGGERALFNLSLRSAIYRLLAEGIEGAAPMPPLILDEPTVFLDSGHVSRLVDLIEHMRDIGVEQLLVVSHDEELVAAADDLLAVRKDATSNRSSVERVDAAAPIRAIGDD